MAYYTIEKEYTIEYEIKKSTFIATIMPVSSSTDCMNKLSSIRKKYYDATHNCYSYIYTENDTVAIKNSDDGEPSKTAGIVIYDVLKKNNLMNVLCVITRYFGGIKLGANGLVRAYSKATSDVVAAIDNLIKIEKKDELTFSVDYTYVNEVLKICSGYEEVSKTFDTLATFTYLVPQDKIIELKDNLIKSTKNTVRIKE